MLTKDALLKFGLKPRLVTFILFLQAHPNSTFQELVVRDGVPMKCQRVVDDVVFEKLDFIS